MKSIELFAGAGGLALGTHEAGFRHVAVYEWDQNACDTMRRNKSLGHSSLRGAEIVQGDVRSVDFRPFAGEVDFVSGGPPCQPFSIGGKHRGFEDERNMFPEAVRAVREIAPRAFLFENVKGLLRAGFSNYYSYIIKQLQYPNITRRGDEEWQDHLARLEAHHSSGGRGRPQYNVVFQLLNAADYGVPQRRERVIIVGVRTDLGIKFAFPPATHEPDALVRDLWVTGEYWDRHKIAKSRRGKPSPSLRAKIDRLDSLWETPEAMLKPWRTVRDAISDLPAIKEGASCPLTPNHYFNPGAKSYYGHNGSPLDWPAKTLKAGDHGVPGGENTLRFENGSVRYFSVRECARLQTFPDDWILEGSWTESMRQLGNAVPAQLATIVATKLRRDIQTAKSLMLQVKPFLATPNRRASNGPRKASA